MRSVLLALPLAAFFSWQAFSVSAADSDEKYAWILPKGFPKPYVPADNPMTAAKVELGRYLFYDTRMSVNGKASCATCHKQELAFTDGRALGIGATGESHSRSAMSLVNVAYSAVLTWSNPPMGLLEESRWCRCLETIPSNSDYTTTTDSCQCSVPIRNIASSSQPRSPPKKIQLRSRA